MQAFADPADSAGHLAGNEGLAATRALVVEHDAVADEEPISLAIIDRKPMGGELADPVGTARMERRALVLRRRRGPEHLGRPGLVAANFAAAVLCVIAQRLDQPQRTDRNHLSGVFGHLE